MVDATALPLIDLPLIRYTVHPYGQEADAWPPTLDQALDSGDAICGWEVWCESTDMKPKCGACGGIGRTSFAAGRAVFLNAIPCQECAL